MNGHQSSLGAGPIDLRDVLVFQKRIEIGIAAGIEGTSIGE